METVTSLALVLVIAALMVAVVTLLVTRWARQDVLQSIKFLQVDVERAMARDHKERLIHQQHMERLQDHVARGVQLLAKNCEPTNQSRDDDGCDRHDDGIAGRLH